MNYDAAKEAEIDEHFANDWTDYTKIPSYYKNRLFISTDPFAFTETDLHEREKNIIRAKNFLENVRFFLHKEETVFINSRGKYASQESIDASYEAIDETSDIISHCESLTNEQWDTMYPKPKSK